MSIIIIITFNSGNLAYKRRTQKYMKHTGRDTQKYTCKTNIQTEIIHKLRYQINIAATPRICTITELLLSYQDFKKLVCNYAKL